MYEMFYRGKRKDTKQWIYSGSFCRALKDPYHVTEYYLGTGSPSSTGRDNKGNVTHIISQRGCLLCAIIPSTFGRFIGVCDMDGRMIFEGDIVRVHDDRVTKEDGFGVVKWNDKSALFEIVFKSFTLNFATIKSDICIVVGNQFDNPEFLEIKQGA